MEIKATKNGDALEVALSGRLDTNTSPDLEGYLRENLEGVASLAIDLAANAPDIDFIRPDFPYTGIYGQFRALAPSYGFILRYPAGKESITRISEEPWHFRYVGVPYASIITNRGLVLEEYADSNKRSVS